MNAKSYPFLGLLILSVVFVTGSSISQASTESWFTSYSAESRESWDALEGSEMIGAQLFSTQGDYLGQINDFVIDRHDGRISHLILSDVPAMGAASLSIPFSAVRRSGDSVFVHSASEDVYKFYDYGFYGETPSFSRLYSFRATEPMTGEGYRFSELIGSDARTRRGEEVGWIDDVVINFSDGRAVYLVLSDVGGMEGDRIAAPFNTLSSAEGKVCTLDTTRGRLVEGPAFASEDKADRQYADEVYRYYGLQPYWEME
jgi:sporulation protein YlmC with PRC-barrel domain